MKLYAICIESDHGAKRYLHFRKRLEAEFLLHTLYKDSLPGYTNYITVTNIPNPADVLVRLANSPDYLNDLPHDRVK